MPGDVLAFNCKDNSLKILQKVEKTGVAEVWLFVRRQRRGQRKQLLEHRDVHRNSPQRSEIQSSGGDLVPGD